MLLSDGISNLWDLAKLGTFAYWTQNSDKQIPTWGKIAKGAFAVMCNYPVYNYSPTIARIGAQTLYALAKGTAPSFFWAPLEWLEYYGNETKLIEYAIAYGPYIIIPTTVKLSYDAASYIENLVKNPNENTLVLFAFGGNKEDIKNINIENIDTNNETDQKKKLHN